MKSLIKKLIPFNLAKRLRGIWQRVMGLYYYGNKYECPFCGNTFRKLLDGGFDLSVIKEKEIIGAGRRSNNICPRCYSTDRDRLIYTYLKKSSPINKFHQVGDNTKCITYSSIGEFKSSFVALEKY